MWVLSGCKGCYPLPSPNLSLGVHIFLNLTFVFLSGGTVASFSFGSDSGPGLHGIGFEHGKGRNRK